MRKIKIHSHPRMESQLDVPKGHVIIDDDLYWEIQYKYEGFFICKDKASFLKSPQPKPEPPGKE